MSLISFLKKLPIDVGQGEQKEKTAGKKIAFSFVENGDGKVALDLGCRDGYWSERLKEKGYTVHSFDIDPHYFGARKHNLEEGIPVLDKSVDLVWCTEVLEHLHHPEQFLAEIKRIMKPGGIAVLTTPNSNWWFYKVVRLWGWTPKKIQNPDHKQFFSKSSLSEIAKGYSLYGYFPYAVFFLKLSFFIGLLSPTFVMRRVF